MAPNEIKTVIPVLSSDVIADLPLYYRVLAQYLAETGRVVIKDSEKENKVPAIRG
jgi:hypothetical protein